MSQHCFFWKAALSCHSQCQKLSSNDSRLSPRGCARSTRRPNFTQLFAENRGRIMADSLQIVHSLPGPMLTATPALQKVAAGHKRTGSSVADSARKSAQQMLSATHKRTGSRVTLTVPRSGREDSVEGQSATYEKGSTTYLATVRAFLRMLQVDRALAFAVIPASAFDSTFGALIQRPMQVFLGGGEAVINNSKRHSQKREFLAAFEVFDVLETLRSVITEFVSVLLIADRSVNPVAEMFQQMKTVAMRVLDEYEDEIKNDSVKQSKLSMDGTVNALTSNTLNFVTRLLDYQDTIEAVLVKGHLAAGSHQNLSAYICRLVASLARNLELKAQSYDSAPLGALFLLNNMHYILKTAKKANLIPLLDKDFEQKYAEIVSKRRKDYSQCWRKATQHLLEVNRVQSTPSKPGKVSKSERAAIKEKFKGFNKEFDEVFTAQKAYSIPDAELRAEVKKENAELIVPLYSKFLERYSSVPFTKNLSKYLKYPPNTIEQMLNSFFDTSA
eukprot:Opistho-2@86561